MVERNLGGRSRLPTLPLALLLPPSPRPPSRREGGDYKLILPGASPPAPRHQTVYGTDSPCRCGTPAGACPLGRLLTLPLACFLAPIPPPPFPVGRGDYKLILPGAPPPAPRHQTVYGTDIPCRCSTPEGGLPSWSPAAPACSLLSRPHPPAPLPNGKGETIS